MLLLLLAACGKGDGRTVLTVYSTHGTELLTYYEQQFEKANPTIDVQWVDMGSQEVLERLRAERMNPQADVWFGAPAEIFERAANDSLLKAYKPTWAAAVAAEAKDPRDYWYGTYLTPEVIAYNSDAVSDADAPKDWDDVLDPKWKGKLLIRNPIESGSMRAIFGAMIARNWATTAKPDSGYAWLRRLDANVKEYTFNPAVLYQKLGRQEGVITLYNMPDIAIQQKRGFHVKWVIPASGTPLLVDAIAIVHGTKHADAAKLWYEFVTSKQALLDAAAKFTRIPVRADIPPAELPQQIREMRDQIKAMPIDRSLLATHLDEWMKYWSDHIRNQNRGS
ncbi:MAG: extracellular solute-binding protein [Gemmatimonadota bacterium]|nr:extracellular solute-binding protein [Gemmatimonadota bacterium]